MPITDKEIQEALEDIMTQVQVFASAYSLIGSRFDSGTCLEDAEEAKIELRMLIKTAIVSAATQGFDHG